MFHEKEKIVTKEEYMYEMLKNIRYNAALLIIDAQNDFFNLEYLKIKWISGGERHLNSVIKNSIKTINWARSNQIPLIWTLEMHRINKTDLGIERFLEQLHCLENTRGCDLKDELAVEAKADDYYITNKRRWDSFYCTDLDIIISTLNISKLIVIGAEAGACVLTTILSAKMRDLGTIVIKDAILANRPKRLEALDIICSPFAPFIGCNELSNL